MVLLASDFDQSSYLRAADIGEVGSERRVKIKKVTREVDIGEDRKTKPVVWFTNLDKGLVLNKTNLRTLQGAFGDNMELWAGRIVVLFVIMANYRGEMVPATRVRIPPPKDDYRAPSPKPAPKSKPAPKQQVVDDDIDVENFDKELDDDIDDVR